MAIRRSVAAAAVAAVCLSQGAFASKAQQVAPNAPPDVSPIGVSGTKADPANPGEGAADPDEGATDDGDKSMCRMYDDDDVYTAETCQVSQGRGWVGLGWVGHAVIRCSCLNLLCPCTPIPTPTPLTPLTTLTTTAPTAAHLPTDGRRQGVPALLGGLVQLLLRLRLGLRG